MVTRNNAKKIVLSLLLGIMLCGSLFAYPKTTHGFAFQAAVLTEAAINIANTKAAGLEAKSQESFTNVPVASPSLEKLLTDVLPAKTKTEAKVTIYEYLERIAVEVAKRQILNRLVNKVVEFIKGEGDPHFITDWPAFFKSVEQDAVGDVINKTVPFLCSPFSAQVKLALLPVAKFQTGSACTLNKVVHNIRKFFDEFRAGGWFAYQTAWQPQNNMYGAIFLTIDAANSEAARLAQAKTNEAISSKGFLGVQRCKSTGQAPPSSGPKAGKCPGGPNDFETVTPGSVVADYTVNAINMPANSILTSQELSGYIAQIVNAGIDRIISESGGIFDPKTGLAGVSYPNNGGDLEDGLAGLIDQNTRFPGETCTDTEGNPGIYDQDESGTVVCKSLPLAPAPNQLDPARIALRNEMIANYKLILDNQREMLLLKEKTLDHMNSVIFFSDVVFPQIPSCPQNSNWKPKKWGADLDITALGKAYAEGTTGPAPIDKVKNDIDEINGVITDTKNRLDQLQASYDAFTAQNMGISIAQVNAYNNHLVDLIMQGGVSGGSGLSLLSSVSSVIIPGSSSGLGGVNNTTPGGEAINGYVALLVNNTFTFNFPGDNSGTTYTVPSISPILVNATDTIFTSAVNYAQFYHNNNLTNETVDALWASYQNFRLENWLAAESVTTGSPFYKKNITDATNASYSPYFQLYTWNFYALGLVNGTVLKSSPDPISVLSAARISGGGLIGYTANMSDTSTLGGNNVGAGLYTNCVGTPVYNQSGY